MNTTNRSRTSRSKPALVADHLIQHGRITEGHALIEYGRFSVARAVYALRHEKPELLPQGTTIRTVMRRDVNGQPYAEWHLVPQEELADVA